MENTASDTLFILGAGFTKAANPKAPLNRDLLNEIIRVNPDPLTKYREECKSTEIEEILTRIDIALGTNSNDDLKEDLNTDRKTIQEQIASYFKEYHFNPKTTIPPWVEPFANSVLKPNDTILSLNYDCYLEGALDYFQVWTPNGGYPKGHPMADDIAINPHNIKVFKIHGSENFCESAVWGTNQTDIGFVIDGATYPRSGRNEYLGGGIPKIGPYIIAPSFVKIPHVQIAYMMLCLIDIAKEAKNLIIIGCGMRPEDNFLWLVLTRFLYGHPKDLHKKLIILDPNADKLLDNITRYFTHGISQNTAVVRISSGIEDGINNLIGHLNSHT